MSENVKLPVLCAVVNERVSRVSEGRVCRLSNTEKWKRRASSARCGTTLSQKERLSKTNSHESHQLLRTTRADVNHALHTITK